jgi:hypothetical protein
VKVRAAAAKYRAARHAISTLSPILNQQGWEADFPFLNDSDIKGLTDASAPTRSKKLSKSKSQDKVPCASEGRRVITWIWKRLGTLESGDEYLQDGNVILAVNLNVLIQAVIDLQIESCKSKACADRWAEEVELLQEEMKCVKLFFETRASQWAAHAKAVGKLTPVNDLALAEGLCAYANNQATQFCAMRCHCEHIWRYVEEYVALGQEEVVPSEALRDSEDDDVCMNNN